MAKFEFQGIDEYIAELQKLEQETSSAMGKAIYKGAGLVADNIKAGIESLPTDDRKYVKGMRKGIHPKQKEGLINGLGIAKMENKNGFVNVKIGFNGYNTMVTDRWPNGQPNVLIARATESGTSFLEKYGYISKAVRNSKKQCEEIMKLTIDEEIQNIIK